MEDIIISRMTCEKRFEAGGWRDSIENMVIPQHRLAGFKTIIFDTDFFEQNVTFDITMNFHPVSESHNGHVDVTSLTLMARFQSPDKSLIDLKHKMKKNVDDIIRNRTRDIELLKQDAQTLLQKCCNIDPNPNSDHGLDDNDCLDDNIEAMQRSIGLIAEQIKCHQREIGKIKQDAIEIKNETIVTEYTIVLYRDRIKHINGLPGQKKPFSLCWFTEQDKNSEIVPTNVTTIDRSINVTYSDLEKL
jgi:hypothetical protein